VKEVIASNMTAPIINPTVDSSAVEDVLSGAEKKRGPSDTKNDFRARGCGTKKMIPGSSSTSVLYAAGVDYEPQRCKRSSASPTYRTSLFSAGPPDAKELRIPVRSSSCKSLNNSLESPGMRMAFSPPSRVSTSVGDFGTMRPKKDYPVHLRRSQSQGIFPTCGDPERRSWSPERRLNHYNKGQGMITALTADDPNRPTPAESPQGSHNLCDNFVNRRSRNNGEGKTIAKRHKSSQICFSEPTDTRDFPVAGCTDFVKEVIEHKRVLKHQLRQHEKRQNERGDQNKKKDSNSGRASGRRSYVPGRRVSVRYGEYENSHPVAPYPTDTPRKPDLFDPVLLTQRRIPFATENRCAPVMEHKKMSAERIVENRRDQRTDTAWRSRLTPNQNFERQPARRRQEAVTPIHSVISGHKRYALCNTNRGTPGIHTRSWRY